MRDPKRTRKSAFHRFYLITPKEDADAGHFAEELLSLKPVEEVFITDGDYGYLVKTRLSTDKEPKDVTRYIERHVDQRYGKLVSYYKYKKWRKTTPSRTARPSPGPHSPLSSC